MAGCVISSSTDVRSILRDDASGRRSDADWGSAAAAAVGAFHIVERFGALSAWQEAWLLVRSGSM